MITVTRIRLDKGAPAVVRATADHLDIALDEREITDAGATALERALNGLAGPRPADPEHGQPDC